MDTPRNLGNKGQFALELKDCAKTLVEKLQSNNYNEASDLIQSLYEARDQHLFNAVGNLTRTLHNAIMSFNVDAGIEPETKSSQSEIRDASDRLQYVIKMTQEAADRTMDRVESSAPIAMNLSEEAASLKVEWEKLRRRELSKEEFGELYGRIGEFLQQLGDGADQLNGNLQAIILEQGFQDITGQVLKKVIGLVTDVEKELVNLVRIAGQVDEVTGMVRNYKGSDTPYDGIAAEGPQIHADKRSDVVSGQDDVDDLLSSLGF